MDKKRFLVLRGEAISLCNHRHLQPHKASKESDGYAGLEASLENVYLAGSVVIDELLTGWDQYSENVPTAEGPDNAE